MALLRPPSIRMLASLAGATVEIAATLAHGLRVELHEEIRWWRDARGLHRELATMSNAEIDAELAPGETQP